MDSSGISSSRPEVRLKALRKAVTPTSVIGELAKGYAAFRAPASSSMSGPWSSAVGSGDPASDSGFMPETSLKIEEDDDGDQPILRPSSTVFDEESWDEI